MHSSRTLFSYVDAVLHGCCTAWLCASCKRIGWGQSSGSNHRQGIKTGTSYVVYGCCAVRATSCTGGLLYELRRVHVRVACSPQLPRERRLLSPPYGACFALGNPCTPCAALPLFPTLCRLQKLKESFKIFDKNGDGKIDVYVHSKVRRLSTAVR